MSDTLQLLGKLAADDAGRDAVHIAVAPVVAAQILKPGEHVGWIDDGREKVGRVSDAIGIVDPFIKTKVMSGERFYLFLYPQTITSLRHVWQHPAFADEGGAAVPAAMTPQDVSRRWIEAFAAEIDQTYNRIMEAAELWVESEGEQPWESEYTYDNSERYKRDGSYEKFPEFWEHYAVVTGRKAKHPRCFFTCSC